MTYLPVGSILDHRNDPNPSNGDHLDVKINRLYGDKGHVNPLTKPGLLNRIRVGKDRKGLDAYPITSGYGPRDTGIKGASKYHKGIDYGIPAGTNLFFEGEGRYSPENTIGAIYTKDAKGNPYEVLLTHTKLGQSSGGVTDDGSPAVVHSPDEDGSFSPPVTAGAGEAKERAQQFITRKRTAGDVVDGFGNGFDQMKSTALADNLQSAQEAIIQKRMDAGESFGSITVPQPQQNNG